jgi:hypothetical protein
MRACLFLQNNGNCPIMATGLPGKYQGVSHNTMKEEDGGSNQ